MAAAAAAVPVFRFAYDIKAGQLPALREQDLTPGFGLPDSVREELIAVMESYVQTHPNPSKLRGRVTLSSNKGLIFHEPAMEKALCRRIAYKGVSYVFDPFAFYLKEARIEHPITLDLTLDVHSIKQDRGLTTGALRFPHLLKDIHERYNDSEGLRACIVGPGMSRVRGLPLSCPQFVELRAILPEAHIELLDNDSSLLAEMRRQVAAGKCDYFPLEMRFYTYPESPGIAPEAYFPLFEKIRSSLKQLSELDPLLGQLDSLSVKVNSDKTSVRNFDIRTSQFRATEEKTFDLILATFSITNAYANQQPKPDSKAIVASLLKFLRALKIGGSLYIDAVAFSGLSPKDAENLSILDGIEKKLGSRLERRALPLNAFDPSIRGPVGILQRPQYGTDQVTTVTSSTIIVLTRLPVQVD